MPKSVFTVQVIEIIRGIPYGKVSSYGEIAALADNPRAARQVARILHSCSETENLPWWRVVKKDGSIALQPGMGLEEQEDRLQAEGIELDASGRVDLARFLWMPDA